MQRRMDELWDEIKTIDSWNLDYSLRQTHDFIDMSAWEARRRRLFEIAVELECLRTFHQLEASPGYLN